MNSWQHQLSYPLPFQRSLDSNGPDKVFSICLWTVGSCIHWTPHCCDSAQDPSHRTQLHTAINHVHIYKDIRYVTRIPYIFPQTCRKGFPKVAAWQSTGARGSVQCRGRLRMNAEAYVLEDGYRLWNPCSHATTEALSNDWLFCHTPPRIMFVRI